MPGGDLAALGRGGGAGVDVVDGQVLHVAAGHEGGRSVVEAEPVGGAEPAEEVGGLGQRHPRGVVAAAVDGDEHDLAVGESGVPAGQDDRVAADALHDVDGGGDAERERVADAAGVGHVGQLVERRRRRAAGGEDGAVGRDRPGIAADADDLERRRRPDRPDRAGGPHDQLGVGAVGGVAGPGGRVEHHVAGVGVDVDAAHGDGPAVAGGDRTGPVERAGLEAPVPGDDQLGPAGDRRAEQPAAGDDATGRLPGGGVVEVGVDAGEAPHPAAHLAGELTGRALVGDGVMAADGHETGGAGGDAGDVHGLGRIGQGQGLMVDAGGQLGAALRLVAGRDGTLGAERRHQERQRERSQQDPSRGVHEPGDSWSSQVALYLCNDYSCCLINGKCLLVHEILHLYYSAKISTRSPSSRSCKSNRRPVAPPSMARSRSSSALPLTCGARRVPRRRATCMRLTGMVTLTFWRRGRCIRM